MRFFSAKIRVFVAILAAVVLAVAGIGALNKVIGGDVPQVIAEQRVIYARRSPPGGLIYRDVVYQRRFFHRQELDIYMPEGAAADGSSPDGVPEASSTGDSPGFPTVVFFHGGSWMHGNKEDIRVIDRFLAKMRREGWAVVSVNYVTSPIRLLEGPSRNVRHALSWLKSNGGRYGLDPENMGLYSVSAGSHLLLEALTDSEDPESDWRFWLDEYGPADLQAMARGDAYAASRRLARFPDAYLRKHSPLLDIKTRFPPTAIVHGDADRTVALSQSERLADALAAMGTEVTLKVVPGGDHGFFNKSQNEWMEMEDEFIIFMRRHFR